MATYYVDGVSGLDTNTGTSFAQAWQTIAHAAATMVDGDTVNICATGTYTLTSTVTWSIVGTTTNGGVLVTGANATGTVDGTRPTITSSTNSVALFTLNGSQYIKFRTLKFTHTAATRGNGFVGVTTSSTNITISDVVIDGCLNGIDGSSRAVCQALSRSTIKNCTNVGLNFPSPSLEVINTLIYSNTSHGYSTAGNVASPTFSRCVIAKNGGSGIADTGTTRAQAFTVNYCTIAGNTADGINSAESTGSFALYGEDNILYGNGGYGINCPSLTSTKTKAGSAWDFAFVGGNTSGNYQNFPSGLHDVSVSADPFTNSSTGDYTLNNTAGGGAAVRAAGFPGTFPEASWSGYLDGGAVQHQAAGGSGGGANLLGAGTLVAGG